MKQKEWKGKGHSTKQTRSEEKGEGGKGDAHGTSTWVSWLQKSTNLPVMIFFPIGSCLGEEEVAAVGAVA